MNADSFGGRKGYLLSHNAFAYCNNEPIKHTDDSGHWLALAIVLAGICIGLAGCSQKNSAYSGNANCYAYAFKLETDPRTQKPFSSKPQPGEFAGKSIINKKWNCDADGTKRIIVDAVKADCEVLGLTFSEIESNAYVCEEGEWLVALAYAPDLPDYHWWRKNEDGTWYHKPGSTPVQTVDSSGMVITDPGLCDRGYYSDFLGYFVVSRNT